MANVFCSFVPEADNALYCVIADDTFLKPVMFPCNETLYSVIVAVVPLILVKYALRLSSDCANNLSQPCCVNELCCIA